MARRLQQMAAAIIQAHPDADEKEEGKRGREKKRAKAAPAGSAARKEESVLSPCSSSTDRESTKVFTINEMY